MTKKFNAVITKEDNLYVAHCVELDVVSQGKTIEEAEAKLDEYAKNFWSDLDEGEEPADKGSYSFDDGNVIMFANIFDVKTTLNDYAERYMLEI